jgi:hypothetical protein
MKDALNHLVRSKWLFVLLAVFILACLGIVALLLINAPPALLGLATPIPISVDTGITTGAPETTGEPSRMTVELSEGQEPAQGFEPLPLAAGDPLTEEEIERILARLAALGPASVEQTDFNPPADLLPPPRQGQTIEQNSSRPRKRRPAPSLESPVRSRCCDSPPRAKSRLPRLSASPSTSRWCR